MQKIFIQVGNVPFSVLVVLFRVGSRSDPVSQEGITHLVEHLTSTLSESDPVFLKKIHYLERYGILFQAVTTKEYTAYICIQPKDKTQKALNYLMKYISRDGFIDTHITQQKKVILQELHDEYSDIDKSLFNGVCEGLWPGSSLAHPIAGTVSSVKKITRKDINKFISTQFTRENIILMLLGHENVFHRGTCHDNINQQKLKVETFESPLPVVFKDHVTLGNRLRIGMYFRTVPAYMREERAVFSIIADLLAGYRTSILNQVLRVENMFTYWVDQYVEYFSDTGLFGIEFSTSNKDALTAIHIVQDKINLLSSKLQKSSLINERIDARVSEIVRESHNPDVLANWYIDECLHMKDIITFEKYMTILKNTTPQKVRDITKAYLNKENRTVVVVGTPSDTMRKRITTTLQQ